MPRHRIPSLNGQKEWMSIRRFLFDLSKYAFNFKYLCLAAGSHSKDVEFFDLSNYSKFLTYHRKPFIVDNIAGKKEHMFGMFYLLLNELSIVVSLAKVDESPWPEVGWITILAPLENPKPQNKILNSNTLGPFNSWVETTKQVLCYMQTVSELSAAV